MDFIFHVTTKRIFEETLNFHCVSYINKVNYNKNLDFNILNLTYNSRVFISTEKVTKASS